MDLLDYIKNTPLLRPTAFPIAQNIAIVCRSSAILHIPDYLVDKMTTVYVIDYQENGTNENIEKFKKKHTHIDVFDIKELESRVSHEVVHFHHEFTYHFLATCAFVLRQVGYECFYNIMPIPYNSHPTTAHIPGYYKNNKDDLEFVFGILADEESKKTFAARIRAIETGNVGYIRVSNYPEYFHPCVQPKPGDIIIDGGVSEEISAQIKFSHAVGEKGTIYGFDPDPVGFSNATVKIREKCSHENYRMIPLGLWKHKDTLYFELLGLGTHVTNGHTNNAVKCDVVSIDDFVIRNRITRVDFIKLDVEGSEREAIEGAITTILRNRPKLAVCLYHKPDDLFALPKLIYSICRDYIFYIGHHHASLHETVLYASVE
uniref:FkbM family methyltransferase n=1 Tax=Desulfacinum infernum TaxID=35837 RepID=A0A832EA57_9BACT